jgi:hypothetical protein
MLSAVDNVDVVGQPIDLFRAGQFNQVPMIFGSTTEEALLFIYMASEGNRVSDAIYSGVLLEIFGFNQAVKVIAKYPPPIFGDKRPLLSGTTQLCLTFHFRHYWKYS